MLEGAVGADADRAVACRAVAQHREGVAVAIAVVRQHTGARGNREGIAGVHRIAVVHRRRRSVLHLDRQRRGRGADAVTHHRSRIHCPRSLRSACTPEGAVGADADRAVACGAVAQHREGVAVAIVVVRQHTGARGNREGIAECTE